MRCTHGFCWQTLVLALAAVSLSSGSVSAQQARPAPTPIKNLEVVSVFPAPHTSVPVSTTVRVTFDRRVLPSSVDSSSFGVIGRQSGAAGGTFQVSGRRVTFTPDSPFAVGETVTVNLSRQITSADFPPRQSAGYAFQFTTDVEVSTALFEQIDVLSNTTGPQTRIYGAAVSDLNGDDFLDLTTVNEVSADLRVFLNLGDGTGNFSNFLTPVPIGLEASPNEPADFDADGKVDLCAAAADDDAVWVAFGNGAGNYGSTLRLPVGSEPHGIVALDVDGDGDPDIVNANHAANNLSLILNLGARVFGPASFFNGAVMGEYGLAAGDMNLDGRLDLVVAGRDGSTIRTLFGDGDGNFTALATGQFSGGETWVVTLGDVNADGQLDATTANGFSNNGGVLIGNGDGTFDAPALYSLNNLTVSTDLGDLDGDGDLDWILSSFSGGFWRFFRNNGSANFSFWKQLTAPSNPSCAIPFDCDNDGDLDLALTDEIADVVLLLRNL